LKKKKIVEKLQEATKELTEENKFPCLICGMNIFHHKNEVFGAIPCLLQLHDILKGHANFNNIMKKLEMKKNMKFIKKKDWKSFECGFCGRSFKFYSGLTNHMEKCEVF